MMQFRKLYPRGDRRNKYRTQRVYSNTAAIGSLQRLGGDGAAYLFNPLPFSRSVLHAGSYYDLAPLSVLPP